MCKSSAVLSADNISVLNLYSFMKYNIQSLPPGYEGIFKRRSIENVDGCAIYYKSDKFSLIESTTVEYFQGYLENFCILDRNNVAIIVKLALNNSTGNLTCF